MRIFMIFGIAFALGFIVALAGYLARVRFYMRENGETPPPFLAMFTEALVETLWE